MRCKKEAKVALAILSPVPPSLPGRDSDGARPALSLDHLRFFQLAGGFHDLRLVGVVKTSEHAR